MRLVCWIIGFTIANFGWEIFQAKPDWRMATRHSYLQIIALAFVYWELS